MLWVLGRVPTAHKFRREERLKCYGCWVAPQRHFKFRHESRLKCYGCWVASQRRISLGTKIADVLQVLGRIPTADKIRHEKTAGILWVLGLVPIAHRFRSENWLKFDWFWVAPQ